MYVCTYICTLTVQDIIISNPLKSAGVIELEVVMLYSDGGSVKIHITTLRIYVLNAYTCSYVCTLYMYIIQS